MSLITDEKYNRVSLIADNNTLILWAISHPLSLLRLE